MSDVVTPKTSTRLLRLRSPDKSLTADLGLFKSSARNAHKAWFARSSTAGACNLIFSAPAITPATSFLLACGCTRTSNDTDPRSGCACNSSETIFTRLFRIAPEHAPVWRIASRHASASTDRGAVRAREKRDQPGRLPG